MYCEECGTKNLFYTTNIDGWKLKLTYGTGLILI